MFVFVKLSFRFRFRARLEKKRRAFSVREKEKTARAMPNVASVGRRVVRDRIRADRDARSRRLARGGRRRRHGLPEPLRLPGPGAGLDGREGLGLRLLAVESGIRPRHPPEERRVRARVAQRAIARKCRH